MALAAYNVGTSHLVDARIITEQRGLDPHKWIDVKTSLPLLAKHKWYKDTRAGYARGWEPVQYVENTRSYYDLLHHLDAVNEPREPEPEVFSILPQVP
jgi:membrane-bound lytic murein transglycosylase F